MTWISRGTTMFGAILLAHACYSAQEHSALQSSRTFSSAPPSATISVSPSDSLPVDIVIEAMTATIVVCLGLILGAPALRPIRWRIWAGTIEREGSSGFSRGEAGGDRAPVVANPFRMLEARPGFVDIRRQRKEFTQWAKGGGNGSKDMIVS